MKKYILLAITALCLQDMQAQTVVHPSIKTKTTFAIVVDQKSYDEAKSEIDAYRTSIEKEGLGTYLLIDDWKRPEPIREQLVKLHENEKMPLEGCVFIGDIPIPMIRDAHHLSSAFKRSPKANWQKSSVPSDRYYDDFGLKFDYIKQDSLIPDYHYMTLRADSKQYISPDIYSARIRPLHLEGENRYQMLRDYLKKAVAEKAKQNAFDQLTMARGHGYNSEDPLAWSGEQMALREQLPQIFKSGNTVKFYDFDMRYPMKPLYLNEIQREGLDVMLFHHHGGPTMQYINGYENGSGINLSIENAKIFLRSKVPSYAKKHGREAAIKEYAKQYGVPESWCAEAFDEEKIKSDSIVNRNMDIYTEDIRLLTPNARFILFDACFMQAVEVAYELRDYTDYCIGSPTEIPGPGASYDAVVPAMFSAENAAVNIAKAYYEPYAAKYDEGKGLSNSNWTAGASVCALRTDKLVDLARITKQVLPGSVDNAQLRSLIFDYDKRRGSDGFQDGHVGYYDMANMMKKIIVNGGYLTWRQAFDAAVVYWATTSMNYSAYIGMFSMEGTNGVSCYIPSVSNTVTDKAYRSTEWYTSAGFAALGW